jgi:hypothetical protein
LLCRDPAKRMTLEEAESHLEAASIVPHDEAQEIQQITEESEKSLKKILDQIDEPMEHAIAEKRSGSCPAEISQGDVSAAMAASDVAPIKPSVGPDHWTKRAADEPGNTETGMPDKVHARSAAGLEASQPRLASAKEWSEAPTELMAVEVTSTSLGSGPAPIQDRNRTTDVNEGSAHGFQLKPSQEVLAGAEKVPAIDQFKRMALEDTHGLVLFSPEELTAKLPVLQRSVEQAVTSGEISRPPVASCEIPTEMGPAPVKRLHRSIVETGEIASKVTGKIDHFTAVVQAKPSRGMHGDSSKGGKSAEMSSASATLAEQRKQGLFDESGQSSVVGQPEVSNGDCIQ